MPERASLAVVDDRENHREVDAERDNLVRQSRLDGVSTNRSSSGVAMSKKAKQNKGKVGAEALTTSVENEQGAAPKQKAASSSTSKPASAKPTKKAPSAKAKEPEASKRKLGSRGAAPWAARHAAKHAAEARARSEQPPLPGSARATVRVPTGAEEIKARIAGLHNALLQIRNLRKNFAKGFYDVGVVLRDVQAAKLYEAKGYGSLEAFLEREIDLGKLAALQLVRIASVFQREAALEHGLDRCLAALAALEMPLEAGGSGTIAPPAVTQSTPKLPLPLKPPASRTG